MAVANTKSTVITNADATPRVANSSYLEHAKLRVCVATVETAAADDNGSVYRMCRVPSGARIHRIQVANDAITAGTDYDIGIYKNAADGGAVVDADAFASAVDLSSALPMTDYTFEAQNIDKIEKRMFEMAGVALSADPGLEYDICLTGNVVGSAAVTISMRVEYVI